MAAILLLLLATSAFAFDVPASAANRFFDTVLQKSSSSIIARSVPDRRFDFLGVSLQLGNIQVSKPSMLKRQGDVQMEQATFKTQALGTMSLGKIDYSIGNLVIDLFGYKIKSSATFTLENAFSTASIYVVQRDRDNCEGTTYVSVPSGKRKVQFQSQNGIYKTLEYIVSLAVQYHLLHPSDIFEFANITNYLESALNGSSNEIFC